MTLPVTVYVDGDGDLYCKVKQKLYAPGMKVIDRNQALLLVNNLDTVVPNPEVAGLSFTGTRFNFRSAPFTTNEGLAPPEGTLVDIIYRNGETNNGIKSGVFKDCGGSNDCAVATSWVLSGDPYDIVEWRLSGKYA